MNNKDKFFWHCLLCCNLVAALASCSDFDDYNSAASDTTASANQTLWETIRQNGQLTQFAALVQKAGFDKELSQSHYYTVWAPLDNTFDPTPYQALGSSALLRQFVKNHIADYGHSASGTINERVVMLNEKSYDFAGGSAYKFAGNDVAQANIPSNNGLMHTINGAVTFYPNLYEYVTDSLLSGDTATDSLRHYFQKYEETYLDIEASVAGPIVDGMQTYVDSVMVTTNSLWRSLNARMLNEDSTYTMLMPTNKAWTSTYGKIESYFNYAPTTKAQTFTNGNIDSNPASISIDNKFWQDSLASRNLVNNLFFSNNDVYNTWLTGQPTAYGRDTLRSTTYTKLSEPQNIIGQAVRNVKLSNGMAYVVDSMAMLPWETYAPERYASAALSSNIARVVTGSYQSWRVKLPNKYQVLEDFAYLHVAPTSGFGKPELDLFLSGVQSATYEFYCIFVPAAFDDVKADTLPNRVIFTLNYCDEKGALKDYVFLDESEANISSFMERFPDVKDNNSNSTTIRAFSNDPTRVDTLYLGDFTFPVCYAGLGEQYRPNIKVTSPFNMFNKNLTSAFTRDFRIAGIIMRPKGMNKQ